jgi:anti-anti-sigma factor
LSIVSKAKLNISCEGPRALLTVIGTLGVPQAVALKRFYVNAILEGINDFTLDCADCTSMDSTFLGTLTGMALRLKKAGGKFRTQNVSIEVLKQMASLGLSQFLSGGK